MVEIYHTPKSLHSFAVGWFREVQNDLNVVPKRGDAGGGDAVAQEIQLGDGEHAFPRSRARPLEARMANNAQRWVQCCSLDLLKTPSSSKKEKT